MIQFTFERDVDNFFRKYNIPHVNNTSFVGQSYLIANGIHKNWFPLFKENSELLCKIFDTLNNTDYFPKQNEIFNAFTSNPLHLKCILEGQDPYHDDGQAHGYSFSVRHGIKTPPSLINIFKELDTEYPGKYKFTHGNLEAWKNDVFLLNASLTVKPHAPGSHMNLWQSFTDNVIYWLSENYYGKVFLLLGSFASKKGIFIDDDKHKIVRGVHPSPLSAHNGFFGSGIFLKIDQALADYGKNAICWQN